MKLKLKKYNSISKEELKITKKIVTSGKLSGFVANNSEFFFGGKYVKKFENYLKNFYGVRYAITLNSWTSGLIAMIGSLDIEPGDEIIVTPWTMSATIASILHWNCIPIFVDIDPDNFCIDPLKIKSKITKRTKAIMVADIFGLGTDISKIKTIINNKKIKILSDSAQTPFSKRKKKIVGTQADAGGFSLNYHKIINCGEGGVIITNNSRIAKRSMLLRNHAEVTNKYKKSKDLSNMIGFNFRMGELEAGIGNEQYKKLKKILLRREKILNLLTKKLSTFEGLKLPGISRNFGNNFYIYPIVLNDSCMKLGRKKILKTLSKNGMVGIYPGYQNIHLLKNLQKKIAFGSKGFPWSISKSKIKYGLGLCPIAEEMHFKNLISFTLF